MKLDQKIYCFDQKCIVFKMEKKKFRKSLNAHDAHHEPSTIELVVVVVGGSGEAQSPHGGPGGRV